MRRIATLILALVGGCGWGQARFDASNSGHNPLEVAISADNVARLVPKYRMVSSIPDGVPPYVVSHGHVFVDGGPVRAFDESGNQGCSGTPRVCAPQWSFGPGRTPTVIDGVLYLDNAAFDPTGTRRCASTPTVCTNLWVESGVAGAPTTDPARLHLRFTSTSGHGSETHFVSGYSTSCPTDGACPSIWNAELGSGSPGGVLGGPARAGNTVYASYSAVGAPSGTVAAFDGSDPAGRRRWTGLVPGIAGPYLAVGSGVVVVNANTSAGRTLFAFDAAGKRNCSGAPVVCLPLWQTDAVGTGLEQAPAIAGGVVYRVGGTQLRAYDAAGGIGCSGVPRTCQRLWIAEVGTSATAPAVAHGLVFTSSNDGFVQAYDAHGTTGCSATTRACAALWDEDVNINLGPVEVGDGRVFVSAGDGSVRVFGLP